MRVFCRAINSLFYEVPDYTTMIHHLPNILTILRVILIPMLVLGFQLPGMWCNWVTLSIFVIAGATDYFDGHLARRLGATTDFGRMLDPIADKMLAVAAIAMLLSVGNIPLVPALIIVCREILVSGLREYLANLSIGMPVTSLAKWKTAVQFAALAMLLVGDAVRWLDGEVVGMSEIGSGFIWLAAALTVVTGYGYWKTGYRYIIRDKN